MTSNDRKRELLGMPIGTATGRLRKALLFEFAKRLGMDGCYRCGEKIDCESDFSIEHIMAWAQQDDPLSAFFDIDNIAFSHLSCNVGAARRPNKKYEDARERHREQFKRYYEKNGREWNDRRNERRRAKPAIQTNILKVSA